ncbi:unnamed protein product [Arabidopsis arenosa]|uniref:Beta-amyrin synthase n=1 Tax=Arabidopsis arenosa TaxID=38785 RepID=A0A8S2A2H8_ARAAE|nr:unnamed protein product [Arabidopsis arenosa]
MWRLRIGAEAGQDPHLFSTNNYLGRQIWEFDANAGSVEELAEVEEARRNFTNDRSSFKASAISFGVCRERKFKLKIPRVRVENAEKITYEDAKTTLRRGLLYMTALQADDGHFPAENSVTMQAQKEVLNSDMQRNEKFMIQSVIASPAVTAKEVTRETFRKESAHLVEETKLRVTYILITSNTLTDVSCCGVGAACHELEIATGYWWREALA